MDDFIAFVVVLLVVSAAMSFAMLLAIVMLALLIVYGLMHVSAWVYRAFGGRDWRVMSGRPRTRTPARERRTG